MKLLSKIIGWLYGIGIDRYMHMVFGGLIASVCLCVFCWLPLWANMLISVMVVLSAALIKDLLIDDKPDVWDILCTVSGGVPVWLPFIILTIWI